MSNTSIFQVCKNLHWIKYMCTKNTWQILNLQTTVLTIWCFHTHLSSWTVHLEFSWDGALFSATPHYSSQTVYQNSLLELHSTVFSSSLKDMMLLAYCGYHNGIKKDQWRIVSVHIQLIHLTVWSRYEMPHCKACTGQLIGNLLHFT